jgi:hypothetical protein
MDADTRVDTRTVALILGLLGTTIGVAISVLYSLGHRLAVVAGITQDTRHLFFGIIIGMVGALGAVLSPFLPRAAIVLLACAGIAFFFDVGWWACFASPFLWAAAALTFRAGPVELPGSAV